MPVRSWNTRILVWPDSAQVISALTEWADRRAAERPELLKVGCFGSYARGDWGVGSDLDLVLIVRSSDAPFERRAALWDTLGLPVPTDTLVYAEAEWSTLSSQTGTLPARVLPEIVWVYRRPLPG